MAFIARTNGGNTVLEIKTSQGSVGVNAVPSADRANWRKVIDVRPNFDSTHQTLVLSTFDVVNDEVYTSYNVYDAPDVLKKLRLKEYATQKRRNIEAGGVITPTGIKLGTTQSDQDKIDSIINAFDKGWLTEVRFKSQTGRVTLDKTAMEQIAMIVLGHVQACFAAEEAVYTAIDNGTYTSVSDIDGHAWPSNS